MNIKHLTHLWASTFPSFRYTDKRPSNKPILGKRWTAADSTRSYQFIHKLWSMLWAGVLLLLKEATNCNNWLKALTGRICRDSIAAQLPPPPSQSRIKAIPLAIIMANARESEAQRFTQMENWVQRTHVTWQETVHQRRKNPPIAVKVWRLNWSCSKHTQCPGYYNIAIFHFVLQMWFASIKCVVGRGVCVKETACVCI